VAGPRAVSHRLLPGFGHMKPKIMITTHVIHKLNFGKRKDRAFTLVEVLVAISIIVLLASILIPCLGKARDQVLTVVCFSRLRQFGLMYEMYFQDNNDSLPGGWNTGRMWMTDLLPYYRGAPDIRLCPKTKKFLHEIPNNEMGVFIAWGIMGHPDLYGGQCKVWHKEGMYGSYGVNGWAHNPPDKGVPGTYDISAGERHLYWRKRTKVRNRETVPLIGDCAWDGTHPEINELPTAREGLVITENGMSHFTLPRHGGKVNMLFMDASARKVGLKELWSLNWHTKWVKRRLPPSWLDDYPE